MDLTNSARFGRHILKLDLTVCVCNHINYVPIKSALYTCSIELVMTYINYIVYGRK